MSDLPESEAREGQTYEPDLKEHAERMASLFEAILTNDKTPAYEYTTGARARNRNGELPDGGRWRTPHEIATDALRYYRSEFPDA